MSTASTARPVGRRRFMSGVALFALIAGALAYARYQGRVAPVALPLVAQSQPVAFVAPRMVESAAARAPAPPPVALAPRPQPQPAQPGWERVMVSPELRVERVAPAAYAMVRERVLLEPERRVERVVDGSTTVVEVVPARYGYRERRVETQPARMVIDTIPAVWEWRPRAGAAPVVAPSG